MKPCKNQKELVTKFMKTFAQGYEFSIKIQLKHQKYLLNQLRN